jgi:serine/threonine-protein kinase
LCETTDYAVKLLKHEHRNDPAAVRLMQREAFVGRDVGHPNLIPVLAASTDGPPFYLVTPLLRGATLGEIIRTRGPLDTPSALWFARQTAEALHELHKRGWLHADVKPDNIFVAANGHATLYDLGLCRRISERVGSSEVLAGTPAYLPPEAFCAHVNMASSSDVYSLGVTLHQSLTGRLPFAYDDPQELIAAIQSATPPDPRHVVPHLSPRVVRLLRSLLAKIPMRRPTASELVDWLVDLEIDTFEERAPEIA